MAYGSVSANGNNSFKYNSNNGGVAKGMSENGED